MTPEFERQEMRLRLERLGEHWDKRLKREWISGRSATWLANHYGLEPGTIEALIPQQLTKRKAA